MKNKILSLFLIFVCVFSSISIIEATASETTDYQTEDFVVNNNDDVSISESIDEEKIICNATIDDNFEDDCVIVAFKNTKSKNFEEHTTKSFPEISSNAVVDLTSRSKNKIKEQRSKTMQAGDSFGFGLTATSDEMIIDENTFHQFVKIDLGVKSKDNVLKCIKKLEARDDILMAFPNYIYTSAKTPNDTKYTAGSQWAINNISLPQAWEITTGTSTVNVGVLDSGIYGNHPDLTNRVNRTLSKDFTGGNSPLTDEGGHGTAVAGIIGAQGNNGTGITGTCWNVSLVSLKIAVPSGNHCITTFEALQQALEYATEKNIPILNYSYGGSSSSSAVGVALGNYPGLFVCVAGNQATDISNVASYPIDFECENTIVVAGSDQNNNIYHYTDIENNEQGSNYSKTKVDLAAPGYQICTTSSDGNYTTASGTSLAAPYVAGVAALLKSKYPTMDAKAIKQYILDNVDVIDNLKDKVETGGRLNAYKALTGVKQFTVIYNANGGGGSMANQSINYGCATNLSANKFTRDGFTFVGWHAKRADGKYYYKSSNDTDWFIEGTETDGYTKYTYRDQQAVARTAAGGSYVTMEAQWQKIYTIIFNSNNGTGTMSSMNFSYGNSKALRLNTFTKIVNSTDKFEFLHWYAKNSAGELYYVNGTNGEWYTAGSNPSTYSRKAFSDGAIINDNSMQGISDGDVITMCAYWEPNFGVLGDVNSSGTVTTSDATTIQKHISGQLTTPLSSKQELLADVNFDNSITVKDVTLIQRYVSHIINEFGT